MASERPPLASVDAVRDELRKLGYLDSGLDRFVLSGAGSASATAASWGAAWRVGVAGGPLFGVALTLAAAGLDRRLLAEPRDLAVLALYLVLAVGAITAVAAFAGGLVAAWAARRLQRLPGPTLARDVGLGLATAALGYLALWWRSHAFDVRWPTLVVAALLGLGLSLAYNGTVAGGRFGVFRM